MILLWKLVIFVNFVSFYVDCQFENQYLGHHYTAEEYNNQELACDTQICLRDAQRLLLAATQNSTIKPCDDFVEFSLGQFIKLGALNDRYDIVGFSYVRVNGTAEMLQYVMSYGGAPFLVSSWDENNFNIKELFEKESYDAGRYFLNQYIGLCEHPKNKSQGIVCLRTSNPITIQNVDDSIQMFKVFNIDVQLIRSVHHKAIGFMTSQYKQLFVVYAFDENEKHEYGTNKSKQRWEQCVKQLSQIFGTALQGLHAERYYKKEVHESVKILIKESVKDFIDEINKYDMNDNAKKDIVDRLNNVQYVIGDREEVLDLQKIDEFYKELELDGTEGNVESFLKMIKHNRNIYNNPKSNWKRQINEFQGDYIEYAVEDNIIYISQSKLEYPDYHPNRSQFFNTANLVHQTFHVLKDEFYSFILKKWNHEFEFINGVHTLAYKNYVKWEELGGKELKLPGFYLTNQQMYWVALVHTLYYKFHPHNTSEDPFQNKNLNVEFIENTEFKEAFNCSKN
ncbi:unnamed protein product [Diamesa hyperborea]